MTILQALTKARKTLQKKTSSPNLDAEIVLTFALKKPKEHIYAHPEKEFNPKKFFNLIQRRAKGEPVAYITGHKEFFGLDFLVDKNVLIPRPETELLVEEALKEKGGVLEVGTGSGCISIAIKKNSPQRDVTAVDISAKALNLAKKNAKLNKVKIGFVKSDLLQKVEKDYDTIVANLPYLLKKEKDRSTKLEPKKALYADIELYERLFKQIGNFKTILCEINPLLSLKMNKLAKKCFPDCLVR
ncbi:MAG: HemK/PrmC family methyltransferase, partial [Patescibacteria group bacterium]